MEIFIVAIVFLVLFVVGFSLLVTAVALFLPFIIFAGAIFLIWLAFRYISNKKPEQPKEVSDAKAVELGNGSWTVFAARKGKIIVLKRGLSAEQAAKLIDSTPKGENAIPGLSDATMVCIHPDQDLYDVLVCRNGIIYTNQSAISQKQAQEVLHGLRQEMETVRY